MSAITYLGLASMVFVAAFTWHAGFVAAHTGGQTPRAAVVEAWVNIVIGFTVNFVFNFVLIPMMTTGGHMTVASNFWGGWVFTTISIVRQYSIRRWFNGSIKGLVARLAGVPT